MFRVVSNEEIAPQLHRMVIEAPRVAAARKPGQFVIVRLEEGGRAHPADHRRRRSPRPAPSP